MIKGCRKGNKNNINFEIVFGITGNTFNVVDIITENKNQRILEREIKPFIEETKEMLSTWDNPNNTDDVYNNYLETNGITIFE